MEGDASWEMTEEEEQIQKEGNGRAITEFMERALTALEAEAKGDGEEAPEIDEATPMTEGDAERWQARQDLLSDRIQARLQREGVEADFERILDEERERLRHETGEQEPPFEWESGRPDWDGLIENAEAMEEDPAMDAEQNFEHPLVLRAEDLFHQLSERSEEEQWLPENAQAEHPLLELINATMCIGGKLAGALNGGLWPPALDHCAITIVRLKASTRLRGRRAGGGGIVSGGQPD